MTHDQKQPMSFTDSLKELQEELKEGKPQPDKPTSLPLKCPSSDNLRRLGA